MFLELSFKGPKLLKIKFMSAKFKKMFHPSYIILRIQTLEGKQCRKFGTVCKFNY